MNVPLSLTYIAIATMEELSISWRSNNKTRSMGNFTRNAYLEQFEKVEGEYKVGQWNFSKKNIIEEIIIF